MKKLLNLSLLIVVACCSTACTGMLYTSIDVLRPAKVAFPTGRLLIVNNAATQPPKEGHSTWLLEDTKRNIEQATDSLSMLLLSALSEEIAGKTFFTGEELIYKSLNTTGDYRKVQSLTADQVKELCRRYNADALLALNRLETSSRLEEFYQDYYVYGLSLAAIYRSDWSVHRPGVEQSERLQFADSLFWEDTAFSRKEVFERFPLRGDALKNGALYIGRKSVKRFLPYWEPEDRYFFDVRGKLMKQGLDSIYAKNWSAAIALWERAFEQSKRLSEKAFAANNLAVAYEMSGDLSKAWDYINKAIEIYRQKTNTDHLKFYRMSVYHQQLDRRRKEEAALSRQMQQ